MVVSDRLTFLAKYREFHNLAASGDYKTASALLHSLLWSRLAPKYFWVTLLTDSLPFLAENNSSSAQEETTKGVFFDSEQTYELMACLYELQDLKQELPQKQKLILEQHGTELRQKLASNLAVALMQENDCSNPKNNNKISTNQLSATVSAMSF
jgi:nuclear pore complex protein Nup85